MKMLWTNITCRNQIYKYYTNFSSRNIVTQTNQTNPFLSGLLANDTNIHAGIRTTLSGPSDYENDGYCGFEIVEAREIDTIGMDGIIKKIRDRVGLEKPVYLSIDIDTLDPACMSLSFSLNHVYFLAPSSLAIFTTNPTISPA